MPGKILSPQQLQALQAQAQKLQLLRNLQHPETLLQMAAKQNPLLASVMAFGDQRGMSFDAMTEYFLQQNGFDVQAVHQQLAEIGLV